MPENNGIVIKLDTIIKVLSLLAMLGGWFYYYITTTEKIKYNIERNIEHIERIEKKIDGLYKSLEEVKKKQSKLREDIIDIKTYNDHEISRIWQFMNMERNKQRFMDYGSVKKGNN